jgi:hypothetical protein
MNRKTTTTIVRKTGHPDSWMNQSLTFMTAANRGRLSAQQSSFPAEPLASTTSAIHSDGPAGEES